MFSVSVLGVGMSVAAKSVQSQVRAEAPNDNHVTHGAQPVAHDSRGEFPMQRGREDDFAGLIDLFGAR